MLNILIVCGILSFMFTFPICYSAIGKRKKEYTKKCLWVCGINAVFIVILFGISYFFNSQITTISKTEVLLLKPVEEEYFVICNDDGKNIAYIMKKDDKSDFRFAILASDTNLYETDIEEPMLIKTEEITYIDMPRFLSYIVFFKDNTYSEVEYSLYCPAEKIKTEKAVLN